jgi:hypothetical protein
MSAGSQKPTLYLSIPLVIGVVAASVYGLLHDDFYLRETPNWALQSRVQDIIDLALISPVLFFSSILAYRGKRMAMLIWGGTNLYLVYTFAIYCFSVHFNAMFLVYVACLGLAFYSMLYFAYRMVTTYPKPNMHNAKLTRITGGFFVLIAVIFYLLWLSTVVADLRYADVPESLVDTGLFTNPVHVIDLAIILPGIFITGWLLWKDKVAGYMLGPVILSFFVLMNLTIALLHAMMLQNEMTANAVLVYVMVGLSIGSLLLLQQFRRILGPGDEVIV